MRWVRLDRLFPMELMCSTSMLMILIVLKGGFSHAEAAARPELLGRGWARDSVAEETQEGRGQCLGLVVVQHVPRPTQHATLHIGYDAQAFIKLGARVGA